MKHTLIFSLVAFISTFGWATEYSSNLVDTNPETDSSAVIEEEEVETVSFYDTAAIYTDDWNNNVTFWYPEINYHDSTVLKLTDSTFGYSFPVEQETTSRFGRRHSSYHKGIDIPLKTGTPIASAFDGKVRYAKWNSGGFGNLVIVRHPNGLETYYAHLSKIKVKPNQVIKAGEVIGLAGSTGRSYSPHLHFEVRYNHKAFDPEKIFNLESFCLRTEEVMVCELLAKTPGKRSSGNHSHAHTRSQQSTADLSKGTVYTIRSGDTLGKIAQRYGTSVNALCKLNGMSTTTILQIGQRIRVK